MCYQLDERKNQLHPPWNEMSSNGNTVKMKTIEKIIESSILINTNIG